VTWQVVWVAVAALLVLALAIYSAASLFRGLVRQQARERELLFHLAQGHDTREVAASMFLSPHTVQDHLKSVFAKTGTRSRRLLLARALGGSAATSV